MIEKWEPHLLVGDVPVRRLSEDQLKRVQWQLEHQTVCRDYDLIDESEYVMVHYTRTTLEGASSDAAGTSEVMPLSPGVICEIKHAFEHHKKVYAVWQSQGDPSPFFDFYCTAWRRSKEELFAFLRDEGIIADYAPKA